MTYEKLVMPVEDAKVFNEVKAAIESSLSSSKAADFFKSLSRAGLRVRDFEAVFQQ